MENLIIRMPAEPSARLNYMYALASCENYHLPTTPCLNVQEMIGNKIFSWYKEMISYQTEEEVSWYNNYE